jgi:hypothetical protein
MSNYLLVSPACFEKHGNTPVTLGIGVHESNSVTLYSPADLATILKSCPKLGELAVHVDLPVLERWDSLCDVILQGQDVESVALLKAIASHPTLYALRILDPPFIAWNNDGDDMFFARNPLPDSQIELAATALQNLAN